MYQKLTVRSFFLSYRRARIYVNLFAIILAKIAFGESVTSPPPFQAIHRGGINFQERLMEALDINSTRHWEGPIKKFTLASTKAKENPGKGVNFASSGCGIIDATSAIDVTSHYHPQCTNL